MREAIDQEVSEEPLTHVCNAGHWCQKLVFSSALCAYRSRVWLGKLRPILHWCFVPDGEHGSGTGDHWHGGKRRPFGWLFDPVGEIF